MTASTRIVIGTWWPHRQPMSDPSTIYLNHRDHNVLRDGVSIHLYPEQFKMLAIVLSDGILTYDELYCALYDDRADGGPTGTRKIIKVNLCRIRQAVRRLGIEIITRHGIGLEARIKEAEYSRPQLGQVRHASREDASEGVAGTTG